MKERRSDARTSQVFGVNVLLVNQQATKNAIAWKRAREQSLMPSINLLLLLLLLLVQGVVQLTDAEAVRE